MQTRAVAAALLFSAALWTPDTGRASAKTLESAALAWETGDYLAALTAYLQILDSAESDEAFEAIALQTGELFRTNQLTDDGDDPRFSPDGRHLVYETGALAQRTTRLLAGNGDPLPVAELPGFAAAFSPDGSQLAYLKLSHSPALREAVSALVKAPPGERARRTAALNALIGRESRLVVRNVEAGTEVEIGTGTLDKRAFAFGTNGTFLLFAQTGEGTSQIYAVAAGRDPVPLTAGPGEKLLDETSTDGTVILFTVRLPPAESVGRGGERGADRDGGPQPPDTFGAVVLPERRVTMVQGSAPSLSADSTTVSYIRRDRSDYQVVVAPATDPGRATVVRSGAARADAPALSPDGSRVAYQLMPDHDWEIYVAERDGRKERRITREIQHDVLPRFLTNDRLLATIGEARHRRSHIYDLDARQRIRVFHNNTVRTIAPEYDWAPSPDGTRLAIVAERDGNTVSPERGVYFVDLKKRVTREELRARVRASLEAEEALRAKARRMYEPLAAAVRSAVQEASVARVFAFEKALFDFDSKHVTQPGNALAAEYLFETYKSFGYSPRYQTFEYRLRSGATGRTSNVIATLTGTMNPELVYVVSSHYDSVAAGPGADDNSSGTAALLETARILARRPQPATIVFASFTGEEAGLLGSREFVRRATAGGMRIVGALNNDMVGWTNDHRLDNTIRYSNAGIRDVQHAAAMQFSKLITYDALYYKGTDAVAYYEAFGDIVGGIGSYPVLGNPHYHQPHDVLDTINHQLVTEVAKTTTATLMLLASSPSRLTNLEAERSANGVRVSWSPSPEKEVQEYIITYGPPSSPDAQQARVRKNSAVLQDVGRGAVIRVKAVTARGLEGWDWARVTVP